MRIRVRTGSRLHLGLLSLPDESADNDAVPTRVWGGAGLMVSRPGVDLEAQPAPRWSAAGPLSERILEVVARFRQSLPTEVPPHPCLEFRMQQCPPQHQGLGTGTQLALAVARILAEWYDMPDRSAPALAQRVGRGQRSALGIHGFDHGGFIVDGGKSQRDQLAPLVARVAFPESWRVVLMLFPGAAGCHGAAERQAFQQLRQQPAKLDTERLCRLVLLGMLPAMAERDLPVFGVALYEFNRRVGEAFAPVQGGIYSHPRAAGIVSYLRGRGIIAVGQSSWGPGLFAILEDAELAAALLPALYERFAFQPDELIITRACNLGSRIDRGAADSCASENNFNP